MTYSFRCNKCGTEYESPMSFAQLDMARELGYNDYIKCPKCGSSDATKLISASVVVFKGDGFTKSTREE